MLLEKARKLLQVSLSNNTKTNTPRPIQLYTLFFDTLFKIFLKYGFVMFFNFFFSE